MKKAYRSFGLDVMRASAIVLVLVSHFVHKWEKLGFWGVEIFFALSGFLIGQILWRNFSQKENWQPKQVVNFWSRRWWRTLPNYYLFLLVTLVCLEPHYIPSLKYFWFGQNLVSMPNTGFYSVAWSLCVEEWFYFLFPVLLFVISRTKMHRNTSFIICIIIFIVASVIARMFLPANNLRMITLGRLDSITYGVAASFLFYNTSPKKIFIKISFLLGFILVLSPLFILYFTGYEMSQLVHKSYVLVLVPLGAALMMPFASTIEEIKLKFLSNAVTNLSLWSYSIYLSHIPILFTTYMLFDKYRENIYINTFSKFLGLFLTIAISALVYNYFELPVMKKRPKELVTF